MSSSNVRSARETRGKTELLNCTNLPGSDSARHNHNAGAGLVRRITAEPSPKLGESERASNGNVQSRSAGERPLTMKRSPRREMKTSLQ